MLSRWEPCILRFIHAGTLKTIEYLVQGGALMPLLKTLSHPDVKLVEAGSRALKSLLQHHSVPRDELFNVGVVHEG